MFRCFIGRRHKTLEQNQQANKNSIMENREATCVVDYKKAYYITDKKKMCSGQMCSSVVICNGLDSTV